MLRAELLARVGVSGFAVLHVVVSPSHLHIELICEFKDFGYYILGSFEWLASLRRSNAGEINRIDIENSGNQKMT